jgi:glycosyltransferase involved in cell wall biosynthesis
MLENTSKVSIIIPSYNSGKFLNKAIESVVSQSYRNLEIIIVNDGSIDDTEKIAKNWQEKDKRIRYIRHHKNRGLGAARNTGIKNSQGEYIAFLDADDVWLPQKIEIQLKKLNELNADLIFSNWYIWEPENDTKIKAFDSDFIKDKKDLLKFFIKKNFGNPSTALLKKSSLNIVGLFDESLKSSEDYDLWLRFCQKGMKIAFVDQPLIYYQVHPDQMTANTYRMRNTRLKVFKKIAKKRPILLIKCPLLLKKIILLWSYKLVQDFLKIFNKKKKYD